MLVRFDRLIPTATKQRVYSFIQKLYGKDNIERNRWNREKSFDLSSPPGRLGEVERAEATKNWAGSWPRKNARADDAAQNASFCTVTRLVSLKRVEHCHGVSSFLKGRIFTAMNIKAPSPPPPIRFNPPYQRDKLFDWNINIPFLYSRPTRR